MKVHRPPLPRRKYSWYSFLSRGRNDMSIKNSNDTIGNRTHDLPACIDHTFTSPYTFPAPRRINFLWHFPAPVPSSTSPTVTRREHLDIVQCLRRTWYTWCVDSVVTPKRRAYQRMDNVHYDILILNARHKAQYITTTFRHMLYINYLLAQYKLSYRNLARNLSFTKLQRCTLLYTPEVVPWRPRVQRPVG